MVASLNPASLAIQLKTFWYFNMADTDKAKTEFYKQYLP
jgi:hypothetical protein